MRRRNPSQSGFTLAEMIVACGVLATLGGVMFTILSMGMTLYSQNASINRTHSDGLLSAEKLFHTVASATEAPVLVDETGAPVAGNGPAAGFTFFTPASTKAYPIPSGATATANSFNLTAGADQPVPRAGDKIAMADVGFKGVVASVSTSGTISTVTFASSIGSGFTPAKTSGTVIPPGSKCFVFKSSAFIAVGSALRYYPRALSVAQHGAGVFADSSNYNSMAPLLPVSGLSNCYPFQYVDPGRRSIEVNLRVRAPAHGGRVSEFYTFQGLRTTIAFRSARE